MPGPMMHQEFVRWKSLISQNLAAPNADRGNPRIWTRVLCAVVGAPGFSRVKASIRFGLQPWRSRINVRSGSCRRPPILTRNRNQLGANRILPNVSAMVCKVARILDAMFVVSCLPYFVAECGSLLARNEKPPLMNCIDFSRETSGAGVNGR